MHFPNLCMRLGILTVLAAVLLLAGCYTPPSQRHYDDKLLRACLHECGLAGDANSVWWWSNPSGNAVYIGGYRQASGTQRDLYIVIAREDQDSPIIVDARSIDFRKQWIDVNGTVWELPLFVRDRQNIDRSSGLFLVHKWRTDTTFSVGRMDHPEGWLFTAPLPLFSRGVSDITADGENIVVWEPWNFCVHGFKNPRPYCWVYSPDPEHPGNYVCTHAYWGAVPRHPPPSEGSEQHHDGDWLWARYGDKIVEHEQ